jgi:hypothetical protein
MAIRYGVQVRGTSGRRLLVVRLEYSMILFFLFTLDKLTSNKPTSDHHSSKLTVVQTTKPSMEAMTLFQ